MNPNYIHTITLYSRIKAEDTEDRKEQWIRTVLQGCFWKSQVKIGFRDTGATSQNVYVVRIPEDERYCSYHEFAQNPAGRFTVSEGDVVVLGECGESPTGKSGQTITQILNRYKPEAFKVTAFSDNTSFPVAKHYRLGG